MPAATSADQWLPLGLLTEIPLLALTLPRAWEIDRRRQQALAARRSPGIEAFTAKTSRNVKAWQIAAMSRQHWVQYADNVETWSLPVRTSSQQLAVPSGGRTGWLPPCATPFPCPTAAESDQYPGSPQSTANGLCTPWRYSKLHPIPTARTMPLDDCS